MVQEFACLPTITILRDTINASTTLAYVLSYIATGVGDIFI